MDAAIIPPDGSSLAESAKGITVIVISNRPNNFRKFVVPFLNRNIPMVAVVDHASSFQGMGTNLNRLRLIETNSTNFSYIVNLGRYFVTTSHYILLADDEDLSSDLLEFIDTFHGSEEAIKVRIVTTFGNKVVWMWSGDVPRIFRRDVEFVHRVHEVPILGQRPLLTAKGQLTNHSYNNWHEFWKKVKNISLRETKSVHRFVNLVVAPLYWFFKRGGGKDGFFGIELVIGSHIYALFSLLYGIKGHRCIEIQELKKYLDTQYRTLSLEEQQYINTQLAEVERGTQVSNERYREALEQLSSALILRNRI